MSDSNDLLYKRFSPSPRLASLVEHFWVLKAPGDKKPRREILIPNGRPLLLMSFANPSIRIDPITRERVSNCNALSGVITKPFVIEQFGEACYLGAQFRPYGLAAFYLDARLVNQVMPIEQWLGGPRASSLRSLLSNDDIEDKRVETLDAFLQTALTRTEWPYVRTIELAINRIESEKGLVNVEKLAQQLNISYVTLYRMFKSLVGVGPKQFSDIVRYYTLVGSILGDHGSDARALIASLQGYYDQAHAAKEFKRFTGVTQSTFRSTLNGIATLMHQT